MNKELERLAHIIEALNIYHAQLLVDGYSQWADRIAMIREDMFWLYHEMGIDEPFDEYA